MPYIIANYSWHVYRMQY